MTSMGFEAGGYNACTYFHRQRNLISMAHGDDFATTGKDEDAKWLETKLKERFEIKTHLIGKTENMSQEGKVLNRVLRRTEDGWEYEADPRHAELLVKSLNSEEATPVSTAGEDEKEWKMEEEPESL